jgi:electron transport complex protein RnfC
MLEWLTRKSIIGGLYFGPPGWHPAALDRFLPLDLTPQSAPPDQPAPDAAPPSPADADLAAPEHDYPIARALEIAKSATPPHASDPTAPIADPLPTEEAIELPTASPPQPAPPSCRAHLMAHLAQLGIGRTSATLPPLLDQLTAPNAVSADTLIIHFLATQPESALPRLLAAQQTDEITAGIDVVCAALALPRVIIAFDKHDFVSWRRLRRLGRGKKYARSIRRVGLLNRYPQGDPTVLLRVLLRRILRVGGLPTEVGAIIVDPVTLWAIGRHKLHGELFTQRPVQIFRQGQEPEVIVVPLQTALPELCPDALDHGTQTILHGMLAGTLADPYTTRITSDLETISLRPTPPQENPSPCIECGWCVDHCPTALNPAELYHGIMGLDPRAAKTLSETDHCIGCGLCSYVCPTRLPLAQTIRPLHNARVAAAARTEHPTPVAEASS